MVEESEKKTFDPFPSNEFSNKGKVIKALNHNKFACFCLQGKNLELALKHFKLALDVISNENFFTNVFQNLGNTYAQYRDYDKAIEYYERIIKYSPYSKDFALIYFLDHLPEVLI